MNSKPIATTALATLVAVSLIVIPVSPLVRPAQADAGDAIAGAIIGGIIGHAIAKDQQRKRKTYSKKSTKSTKSSGISSAQREQNREVQMALNHFGYPVGTPDGSIGPKSRAAISGYQAFMGYPATGQLTDFERNLLVTSYARAQAGGAVIAQTMATSPWGVKGVLLAQRDEMTGVAPMGAQAATAGVMAQAPAVAPPVTVLPTLAAPVVAAAALPALMPEAEPAPQAALPSFMASGATQGSLASQCNKVSLLTNTNGGYTTVATMTDAGFALSEQFCLARTYAMASGEELAAQVAGFTPQQIAEQCAGFGPVLKDHVAALSQKPMADVVAEVQGFVAQSGMAPAQLSGTAKVCLGVGYTTDDMNVAIGSALLLTALGEAPYAELLGHHLSQGFGASARPDMALEWYDAAQSSGTQVFAPGLQGRGDLIRKAALTLTGRADEANPAPVVKAALPSFAVAPEPAAAPVVAPVSAPVATTAADTGAGAGASLTAAGNSLARLASPLTQTLMGTD